MSSSLTGLLVATVPFVAALLGRLAGDQDRLTAVRYAGMGLGVVGIVVQNGVLLGRMTTDVSQAQGRASNLSNGQREALRLLLEINKNETDRPRGTSTLD